MGPVPSERTSPISRLLATRYLSPPFLWLWAGLVALVVFVGSTVFHHDTVSKTAGGAMHAQAEKPRDTVVWRDESGVVFRAKVDRERFTKLLTARQAAAEELRRKARAQATDSVDAGLATLFADAKTRVPRYAKWYFTYTTRYVLMAHAVAPALQYSTNHLLGRRQHEKSLVDAISMHMVRYLEEQYMDRVLHPAETEAQLQILFSTPFESIRMQWDRVAIEQRRAMHAFIVAEAKSPERLSAERAAGLTLDWDGKRNEFKFMHQDAIVSQSFRRGMLNVMLEVPSSESTPNGTCKNCKETAVGSDEISHVILNLFGKIVDPIVSEVGNIVAGILAGGVAGGTAAGFAVPPGMAMTAVATTTVPIGAAIGLATTVAAEMLSNRMEEALSRAEFEKNLGQTLDETQKEIESRMVSVIDDHIDAWFEDVVNPGHLHQEK